jgi:hypothetical protein
MVNKALFFIMILFKWIKNNKELFFVIIACLCIAAKTFVDWKNINNDGIYTVGIIERISKVKGVKVADYKVVIDGEELEGSTVTWKSFTEKNIGEKYLVKCEKGNLQNNQMLFDFKLDSVNLDTIFDVFDTLKTETKFWLH